MPVVICQWVRVEASREGVLAALNGSVPRPERLDTLCLAGLLCATRLGAETLRDERHAVVLGTMVGCLESDHLYWSGVLERGRRRANPRVFAYTLPNVVLGEIAIRHGLVGDNLCVTAGRASALSAVGAAADLLVSGACDVALVLALEPTEAGAAALFEVAGTEPVAGAVGFVLRREGAGTRIVDWGQSFDPTCADARPDPDVLGLSGTEALFGEHSGRIEARCPSGHVAWLEVEASGG